MGNCCLRIKLIKTNNKKYYEDKSYINMQVNDVFKILTKKYKDYKINSIDNISSKKKKSL